MLESVQITAEKIRSLKVQGARNVAIASIKSLQTLAKKQKVKNKADFLKKLTKAKEILFLSRETEPLMRNSIRWIINQVENSTAESVKELANTVVFASQHFLNSLKETKEKIAEIGARRINDKSTILTHCHSSSVTYLLKKAKQYGKSFEIICTETRPAFQGKITAKELLNLNVKTTLIVDSAARFFMNKVDYVIIGADAITSEGNVINKIGTSMIALAAHEARTPLYVVSELLKFDPVTMYGDYEKIEERNPREIWCDPPKKLIIRNPAFDVTRRDYIHGIICEAGIISPHSIIEVILRQYPWVFK